MGIEVPGAGGSEHCWRCRPRSPPPASSRPSGSPSLGPPPPDAGRAARARRTDRWVAHRDARAGGGLPHCRNSAGGAFIDALAPGGFRRLWGDRDAGCRAASRGFRSCRSRRAAARITDSWFSCFIAISGTLAAFAIHRLASAALRRGPAWDCGYPDASPATQYTAGSFAQPIRRVYGHASYSGAREHVEMPAARRHAAGAP